ncbi:adenine phosphoribosyltransferase [Erythrobacter sp.]|jgi:adenine phosphoribosyltransferase|uniref:adenine phosphoribosyltransferase n=1 Tax=Erythrobacter sp. TaxID=1042 RepID=UPI002EC076E8|nr:adenine phosphoribosyltransferase [Erythrobacter sp.]
MIVPSLDIGELRTLIRTVPDFPAAGIQFRDISTLIAHGEGLSSTIHHLADAVRTTGTQAVAGMEARGFIFGAAVAVALGVGFIPVRKPGKLPVATIGVDYALEYGADRLEIDPGAIGEGERIAIVDDLIATGGTALAATELLRRAGAVVEHAIFVIDLPELGGAEQLRGAGVKVSSLMQFDGA